MLDGTERRRRKFGEDHVIFLAPRPQGAMEIAE
jgi:hypothetical protein